MDNNDDSFITFDDEGICNHCHLYREVSKDRLMYQGKENNELVRIADEIKQKGRGKDYDCIIGLSGGVDSTYVAYLSKELGLRPLAVHLDNGWNSELAVINIQNVLDALGLDLYTYVINWKEFRDLQMSFIKASVVDIEILTDQAINAVLFNISRKFGVKYILSGENMETEGIMPASWVHMKSDHINIRAIHKRYGNLKLKTFPILSYQNYLFLQRFLKIQYIPILDYLPYKKEKAKKTIEEKLYWRDYGGKHYESIFTRFYQSYILPKKFNIDKRKSHLSTLICSGQMSRKDALIEISNPPYPENLLLEDKEYILKKFGLSESGFDSLMNEAPIEHTEYPSVVNILKKLGRIKRIVLPK